MWIYITLSQVPMKTEHSVNNYVISSQKALYSDLGTATNKIIDLQPQIR